MDCKTFLTYLSERGIENIPPEYGAHSEQCVSCARALKEEIRLTELLRGVHTPDFEDRFWDEYCSEVISRIQKEPVHTTASLWKKRLLISAAAAVIVITGLFAAQRYYSLFDSFFGTNEAYSSTLDIIWNEYELASSQYVLDSSPLYAVEEVIPENWEKVKGIKKE